MINIRVLKKSDKREGFSCGEIELDYFFQKYVGQNQFKHYIGVTYIATDDSTIFGFATVSMATLSKEDFDLKKQKKLPLYPLPVLKLSRMGVQKEYQGEGFGLSLIKMVFKLALEQKERVGCIGVVVDAKEDAVEFYKKLGFIELEVKSGTVKRYPMPKPMFISIGLLQQAL